MVKIRLSRIGKKHVPFYRIVAVDSRRQRDGAVLEDLGTYDGLKGIVISLREDRLNDWVAKGAVVTNAVKRLKKQAAQAAA